MSNQYHAVAAVLQNAITTINAILTNPDDEMHRIRIANRLQMETDQLLLLTGSGDLTTGQPAVLGPATTIGGKKIGKVRRFSEADLVPSDDKVFNLKQQVEDAVHYFGPGARAEGILANIPELIIRGVAKKAGLKVTKDEPKEITVEFIEQVIMALAPLPKAIETGEKITPEDVEKLAEAIAKPVKQDDLQTSETKAAPAETIPPVDETKAAAVETEVSKVEQPNLDTSIGKSADQPKPDPKKKTGK